MWVQHPPPPSPVPPHRLPRSLPHSNTTLLHTSVPPLLPPATTVCPMAGPPQAPPLHPVLSWWGPPPSSASLRAEARRGWQPPGGLGDNPGVLHPRSLARAYVTAVLQSALLSRQCHRQSCSAEPISLDICFLGRGGREGDVQGVGEPQEMARTRRGWSAGLAGQEV